MSARTDVLIVGAGPVGLTAALALTHAGVTVRVVERQPDVDRRLRASTFHPPTLDLLDELGLAHPLVAAGLAVPGFQMRQHDSGEYVNFDLALIADRTAHPYRLQCEQHRLCEFAIAALQAEGVRVDFETGFESLEQDSDRVDARLDDGTTQRCRWMIGADGGNSTVRSALGLDYGGKTYTHSSVLVSTEFAFGEHLADLADVSYCWSARGPFSLLRLPALWRASLYPGVEDLEAAADEERVRDWLGYIHPDAADADLLDVSPYRVHERCVDRFRVGRVLLAGDAAHLNPPSGGMGMNGGIHDALNLAGKLVEVLRGGDESLLDRYARQRHHAATATVIPQSSANRARMATTDVELQMQRLAEQRRIASDEEECRTFLLRSSMIAGLEEANARP